MSYIINLQAAWISFMFGALSGAFIGLFFHKEQWLGGYPTFSRRLLGLGHIACFGIGLLNLAFYQTIQINPSSEWFSYASLAFLSAFSMSGICFLTAWKHFFRHLFFIPVLSLISGIALTITGILL